jgi:hypothetical protein
MASVDQAQTPRCKVLQRGFFCAEMNRYLLEISTTFPSALDPRMLQSHNLSDNAPFFSYF